VTLLSEVHITRDFVTLGSEVHVVGGTCDATT
jgi:hypothetical protein